MPGQLQIERSRASTSVHHQHESRCISNGRLRLLENFARDDSMVVGQQTSRIDDFKRPAAPGSSAVNTIASNSRLVCDNRTASSREPIEKRRFADIGTTDDNDGWQFVIHLFGTSLAPFGSAYPIRWPGHNEAEGCPRYAQTKQEGIPCVSRSGCSKFVAASNLPSGWPTSLSFLNEWLITGKPPSWPSSCTNPFTFRQSR